MKEYTGKTLEEVLHQIADEKGVSADAITYELVDEKKGFLGIGSEVTVRAYCEPDIQEFMKTYLTAYFNNIEMDVAITIENDEGFYRINLDADNNAILIGRNGQTLQAINTVLNTAVSSEFKKRIGVLIDINGYKEDKYEKVCSLAKRVARTVQRTKTDAVLDPMPADERKAIHNALSDMEHIMTQSEGEGNQRRLKIIYAE